MLLSSGPISVVPISGYYQVFVSSGPSVPFAGDEGGIIYYDTVSW